MTDAAPHLPSPSPARPAGTGQSADGEAPPARHPHPWSWTPRQLSAIAVLTAGLLVLAVYRWHGNRATLDEDLAAHPAATTVVNERINPNTASWASLARLPGIGPKRAKDIVAYREAFVADHPDRPAFVNAQDLRNVPGVGPKTLQNILPYLEPAPAADAAPARP